MPIFDISNNKRGLLDVEPILESPSQKTLDTELPDTLSLEGNASLSGGPTLDELKAWNPPTQKGQTLSSPLESVSKYTLQQNQRYPLYQKNVDLENIYGIKQPWYDQLANGAIKMGATGVGTFAQSFATIPNTITAIKNGDIKDLSNPDGYEASIDTWLKNIEDNFPNYYTRYEKQHSLAAAIPFNTGSANFWGDKVIKNLGFTAGAIGGAIAQDFVVGAVTGGLGEIPLLANQLGKASLYLNKIFAGTSKVDDLISLAKTVGKSETQILNLKRLSELAAATKLNSSARWSAAIYGSARTEAAIEARDSYNKVREELVNQYKLENNGNDPDFQGQEEIDRYAEDAMNTRFGINMALLTVSNTIQFGNLFKSFTSSGKTISGQLTKELGETGRIGLAKGSLDVFEKKGAESLVGKVWESVRPSIPNILTEGVYEEGGQYATEKGVYDYFTRKYKNPKGANWDELNETIDSTTKGLQEQFGTTEGIENMLIGAISAMITGGVMNQVDSYKGEGKNARLQSSINTLNRYGITSILENQYTDTNDSLGISKNMQEAISSNDVFKYKNLKDDMFFKFVASRVPQGLQDVTVDQLNMLKDLPKEDFEKTFGMDFTTSNKKSVSEYVDSLILHANNTSKIIKSIDGTFSNPFTNYTNPENEQQKLESENHKTFNDYKTELSYLASKPYDINSRLLSIQQDVSAINPLVTTDLLTSILNRDKLKELSSQYEKKANETNDNISSLLSPNEKKDARNQIKTLRTASERINLALSSGKFDDKLFDTLLNLELNNQDPALDKIVTPDQIVNLVKLGHDVDRLNHLKKQVADVYDVLSSKEGFVKFFEQAEQLKNQEIPKEEPIKTVQYTTPKGKQENLEIGREYEIKTPKVGKVKKLAEDRWELISPFKESTFYKSEELAKEALKELTESYTDLKKVKILTLNPDTTIKVEDIKGNIYDIDPIRLTGYEKLYTEQEKLKKHKEALEKQQKTLEGKSGSFPTNSPEEDISSMEKEDKKKAAGKLFISDTSASEDEAASLKPHVIRKIKFYNNFKNFPNKSKIRTIWVTPNQENSLGLNGLSTLSLEGSGLAKDKYTDIDEGLVASVYVEQEGNSINFINEEGKIIGKVGESVDLNSIVFSTMPSTSLYWSRLDNNGNPIPRYRAGEQDEATEQSLRWKAKREQLFKLPEGKYEIYDFSISRGIPVISNPTERLVIGNNLIPENKISTQEGLIQISTTGTVAHNGELLKYPKGRTVLQYGDTLQFISNSKFSKKQVDTLFAVVSALSKDVNEQLKKGTRIDLNPKYSTFLQNVLYWRQSKDTSKNQIFIDTDTMELFLSGKKYDLTKIASSEKEIKESLSEAYFSVNDKTLKNEFSLPFIEYLEDLSTIEWKNYQTYLLSSTTPNGDKRGISEIPLTTSVDKPSEAVPYNFKQKYATVQGVELPIVNTKPIVKEKIVEEAPKAGEYVLDGVTENTYTLKSGPVQFTGTIGEDGVVVTVISNETIKKIAENETTIKNVIIPALEKTGKETEELSNEELALQFVSLSVAVNVQSLLPKVETKKEFDSTEPQTQSEYAIQGETNVERITEAELQIFKDWHSKNTPNIPYEVLDNILYTHNNEKAWGVFENGVAKFYKFAQKGTEYHEIFEGIWKAFLSDDERQAILDEFKAKRGAFVDRASDKKISYDEATELQAKERIADDFADFRVGKITHRTLGQKILKFFKSIVEFFKSFIQKPSNKQSLFDSIEAGRFKESTVPDIAKSEFSEARRISTLSEQQINEFVQDITARAFQIIFKDNVSLFSPEKLTAQDIFGQIKDQYIQDGKIDNLSASKLNDSEYEQLVDRTKEFLRTFKIEFDEDNVVTINDEDRQNRDYSPEPFSTNWKKSSPFPVKLLLGTLTEAEAHNQQNSSSLELPKSKLSGIEGFKLVNFSRAFATMLDKLANTTKIGEVINKLVDLAKYDSNYVRLFTRLRGNRNTFEVDFSKFEPQDWRLFINFYQTFTKQKPDAYIQYVKDGEVFSSPANISTNINITKSGWVNNIRELAKANDSVVKYNRSTKTYQVDDLSKIGIKTPQQQVKFLNDIGITFPMEVYLRLKPNQTKRFSESVSSIYSYLGSEKDIMSVTGKTLQINTPLNTLAELLVKVTNPAQELVHTGIDGKKMQDYTDNNAASVFENTFNSVDTLDELLVLRPELNDVFSKNSVVLKKGGLFFDIDGKRIKKLKVSYIQGTNNTDSNKENASSKLALGDRFVQEINQNLNGRYYILVPADSSTEWMMNIGNNIEYSDVVVGYNWGKVYSTLKGYLKDDIAIAKENRADIKNVAPRAKELRFFKDILPSKQLDKINSLIADNATDEDISLYIQDNIAEINSSIKDYISSINQETFSNLLYSNKIVQIAENEYAFPTVDDNFAKTNKIKKYSLSKEQVDNIINFANTNYIINNIEYHKILFGDPYQFKIKDNQLDETKRIKSFLSPRKTTFDSPELNTYLNQNFNKIYNIELSPEDIGYNEFKSFTNTVTISDVEIEGPLMGKTNEADAASWITDNTYREVKIKNGQWSEEAEKWHQWQMAYTRSNLPNYTYTNDKLKIQDIKTLSSPEPTYVTEVLKPIVSGNKANKTNIDIVLDKFSQMPIYYKAVQGTNLEKLYRKMWKEKIGYIITESGRKVGAEKLHPLYNPDGSFNELPFNNLIEVPWSSYGIQVENSYEGAKEQTRGSQITKLSSLDLFDNGKAVSEKAEKEYKRNTSLLNKMHQNAYKNLLDDLGIEDLNGVFKLVDNVSVSNSLKKEMLRRELSENAKDVVQLDEMGQFRIPFEAATHYIQIRDILFSMVDKALISPKMSGGAHVQVPVTLWESINSNKDAKTPTLKFYENEDGKRYCEVLIPAWFKTNFNTEEETLKYFNKSKEGQEILKGIGFRIPTQSQSSIEVFKVKGFLPEFMGRTVVVPSEITTKSGSDFDIDKLNMYLKAVYTDQNGDIKLVKLHGDEEETKEFYSKVFNKKVEGRKYSKSEILEALQILSEGLEDKKKLVEKYADTLNRIVAENEDIYSAQEEFIQEIEDLSNDQLQRYEKDRFVRDMYKKALENEYYDSLDKLITLPENFDRLISPVDDAGLKAIASSLDTLRKEDETQIKNRLLDRNYMTKLRHAFLSGKKWVGIAAVNITGQSLTQKSEVFIDTSKFSLLSEQEQKILGDGEIVLPHNQIDGKTSISGVKTADGKQYISERLSGYATSFVDVAKDPYILKIIKNDLVIGTVMFLERIGVGENTAYFVNQPIISKYLDYLDSIGSKSLYNKKNIESIKAAFPSREDMIDDVKIDVNSLKSTIETYYSSDKIPSFEFNAVQHKILDEFLKYAKMAEYSFKLTQAANYDTTSFRSTNSLYRKQTRTQIARETNIFNSVDKLLESSFIGEQSYLLSYSSEALGEVLKLDKYEYRQIINDVLKPYAEREFFSDDKYNKVADKVVSSFLDYVVQTKQGLNTQISELLVNTSTSIATKLAKAKKDHPELVVLRDLEQVSLGRPDGAVSIKLKVNLKDAYDENLYTDYMRELKSVNPGLYYDIVKLAILQGTQQTNISIKNIIPIEDYSNAVAPVIEELVVDEDVQAFLNGAFQRNNWKDDDVFKTINPKFFPTDEFPVSTDVYGNDVYLYYSPAFPNIKQFNIKSKERRLLVLGEKYNFLDVQNDYLLVPRVVTDNKTGNRIDMKSGLTVSNVDFAKKKAKGDMSLKDVFGYKKVYNEDGTPLTKNDKDGNLEYIYKMINLWGDGQYASEYYTSPKQSVLNNGTVKIDNEIPDSDIIAYYTPKIEPKKEDSTENIPPCS